MQKQKKAVLLEIDGQNVNATHFAAMSKQDAINAMVEDGIPPGGTKKEKEEWAKAAYPLLKKAVGEADLEEDQTQQN